MSQAGGGGKKGGKGPPKKVVADPENERGTTGNSKNDGDSGKDETSSNGDKKETKVETENAPPKPQSAGASTREGAQKILTLAMKSEWTPVEAVIKALEKAVVAGGEELSLVPLAGVSDPVSFH